MEEGDEEYAESDVSSGSPINSLLRSGLRSMQMRTLQYHNHHHHYASNTTTVTQTQREIAKRVNEKHPIQ